MKLNGGQSALAEDAKHPIHPFHEALREHGYSPVESNRSSNSSRINFYAQGEKGKSPGVMIAYNKRIGPKAIVRGPVSERVGQEERFASTGPELKRHLEYMDQKKKELN